MSHVTVYYRPVAPSSLCLLHTSQFLVRSVLNWKANFRFQFHHVIKGKRNQATGMCLKCSSAVYRAKIHYWTAQIHYNLIPNIHYSNITLFCTLGSPYNLLMSYVYRQLRGKSMKSVYSRNHWPALPLHCTFLPKATSHKLDAFFFFFHCYSKLYQTSFR